jgi:hypothetical protein
VLTGELSDPCGEYGSLSEKPFPEEALLEALQAGFDRLDAETGTC